MNTTNHTSHRPIMKLPGRTWGHGGTITIHFQSIPPSKIRRQNNATIRLLVLHANQIPAIAITAFPWLSSDTPMEQQLLPRFS